MFWRFTSALTPSLGALLLTEKFCHHQTFYRQEWRLRASHGIELTRKSRANTCLDNILIDDDGNTSFTGHLQSDGLRAYRTFRERHPQLKIIPVSGLAHIRRKFHEAKDDHPKITA